MLDASVYAALMVLDDNLLTYLVISAKSAERSHIQTVFNLPICERHPRKV